MKEIYIRNPVVGKKSFSGTREKAYNEDEEIAGFVRAKRNNKHLPCDWDDTKLIKKPRGWHQNSKRRKQWDIEQAQIMFFPKIHLLKFTRCRLKDFIGLGFGVERFEVGDSFVGYGYEYLIKVFIGHYVLIWNIKRRKL